jgi:heptosyltransferase-2/heptosyltransferase-3
MLCPFPGFARQPKKSIIEPYIALGRYARLLREKEFDLAVVLRFDHWWGALLAYLARIPCRVGYDIAEVKPFLTDAVPYVPGRHEVEQNLALVEAVNGQPPLRRLAVKPSQGFPLEFPLSAQDREFAARYLAEQGVGDDDPLVCIHPGAGAPVKLWRNEGWARVADALVEKYRAKMILTGSANEGPLVQAIAEPWPVVAWSWVWTVDLCTWPWPWAPPLRISTAPWIAAPLAHGAIRPGTSSSPRRRIASPATAWITGWANWRVTVAYGTSARHK